MGGRAFPALLFFLALSAAGRVDARPYEAPVDIRAGPLSDALRDLARQTGAELLFDREVTAGLKANPFRARMTPEAALRRLLNDTNLTMRQSASGAFLVEKPAAPPLALQDVTVPEVLVIGRRSQNADIRRLETDIQPYRVATGSQVIDARRDNLDQFFRSRVPSNTDALPPSLDTIGETNSQIDLRGLGPNATLILIDGRRMPNIPAPIFGFRQSDLNAMPLHAIQRVETLTGTAGIHGFGALGGAVNVVIARDRAGAEMHVTGGASSRGDAQQFRFEGGFNFTPDEGRTEVMLFAGASRSRPLRAGQRSYLTRDALLSAQLAPSLRLFMQPRANSAFLQNIEGPFLIMKPQFGAETLGGQYAYLPAGLSGAPGDMLAALKQNAGKFDASLSDGEAASALGSTARSGALLGNLRRHFDGGVETYLDAVLLWNNGGFVGHHSLASLTLNRGAPENPFAHSVQVRFPVEGVGAEREAKVGSFRYVAGVATPLPLNWRATSELAFGSAYYDYRQTSVAFGLAGPDGRAIKGPVLNPFGNWSDFQTALASYRTTSINTQKITNRFRDLSLRLAGPLFHTAAGPSTLTLLAERRIEEVPAYTGVSQVNAVQTLTNIASRTSETTSFYAELRSRLVTESASSMLRGLEVQLALRNDAETDDFSTVPRSPDPTKRTEAKFKGTVYTVGAKVFPTSWLMLRGSHATGETPPPLARLIETQGALYYFAAADDPKRGRRPVGSGAPFTYRVGGSPDLDTVRTSTTSFGGVLFAFGDDGARLTLDYSRIRTRRDVFEPTAQFVLNNEEAWPNRVTRGPLTDADRARGYTAGPLVLLDARAENAGGLKVDTVDARLEWIAPFPNSRLRLYGDGTYYIRQSQTAPFREDLEQVGYLGRPLRVRANIGADWFVGPMTIGANIQHFGSYRIYPPTANANAIASSTALQGDNRVPSQTYVDIYADWRKQLRIADASHDVVVGLGLINIFDKAPPRESSYSLQQFSNSSSPGPPGYSRYGDPRQRRVQLTLSAAF